MTPFQIFLSFGLSLLTNMIVLGGAISFLFWLDEQRNTKLVAARPILKAVLSTLFLAYLFGESWIHTYLEPNGFGLHWTFLNMLIIVMFLLNVRLGIRWQGIIEVGLMLCYVVLYSADNTPILWLSYTGFVVIILLTTIWRQWLLQRRYRLYSALAVFAAVTIGLITSMDTVNTDGYFWLRQITALVILSITGIEYNQVLDQTLATNRLLVSKATTDGLTKLKNFGQFDYDLQVAFTNYQTNHTPYAVYELDLDLFKHVNDTYGHPTGNIVLQTVAKTLYHCTENASFTATAYRLGGEEFGVIVQEDCTDPTYAMRIAAHFRQQLAAQKLTEFDLAVTTSIGAANSHEEHYHYHDIYKAADKSLYLSKQRGRNRVTIEGQTIT